MRCGVREFSDPFRSAKSFSVRPALALYFYTFVTFVCMGHNILFWKLGRLQIGFMALKRNRKAKTAWRCGLVYIVTG